MNSNRRKGAEQALAEAVLLFKCCKKNPTTHFWRQLVDIMATHGFNETNLGTSESELRELERQVNLNRATAIISGARNDLLNLQLVEELEDFVAHGILSEEEMGLRPGELGQFKVTALNIHETACGVPLSL